ncbi:MAG: cold shock domain-containing protein [Reichenbachiella sp.]
MAKSQQTFNKKEKEKKRLKKRKDKQEKKEERRQNSEGGGLEQMMAYLDEDGNIVDTPPDPIKKKKEVSIESIQISVPKQEDIYIDPIKKGRVEFFDDTKGFGFIKEIDTQEKYFVHVNGLIDEIKEGDKVVFELEKGMKGMNAVRVKVE